MISIHPAYQWQCIGCGHRNWIDPILKLDEKEQEAKFREATNLGADQPLPYDWKAYDLCETPDSVVCGACNETYGLWRTGKYIAGTYVALEFIKAVDLATVERELDEAKEQARILDNEFQETKRSHHKALDVINANINVLETVSRIIRLSVPLNS